MTSSTTTCKFDAPLYWDKARGLVPPDAGLSTGNAFQYSNATCTTIYDTSSSSQPYVAGGFTYGEVVVSVLIFAALVAGLYAFLWFSTKGIKVKIK